jgi:phosphoribosyl 1,2-cyclic phosphodiesterase
VDRALNDGDRADVAGGVVRVRFWGVRGSIPAPGPETLRYGGNTSCVTLEAPSPAAGDPPLLFIFDAGSGIRVLGMSLLREKRVPLTAHLFLTHTHWDHIQGFPFFVPAFIPGNRIVVYGNAEGEGDALGALEGQMLHRYFPVSLGQLGASVEFRRLEHGAHEVAGQRVTVAPLHHSSVTVGYRVEAAGATVVYLTDAEPRRENDAYVMEPTVVDLARGADVLIHDAQYTDEEYPSKVGWGHSPTGYVVDFARAAGARRLVLFHHDPTSGDDKVDAMLERARARAAGSDLVVDAAFEGMEITLPPGPHAADGRTPAAAQPNWTGA